MTCIDVKDTIQQLIRFTTTIALAKDQLTLTMLISNRTSKALPADPFSPNAQASNPSSPADAIEGRFGPPPVCPLPSTGCTDDKSIEGA